MDQQITAVIVNRQEHKLRVMMFKQEWCDSPKQQTYLITRQCIGDLSRFWLSCIGPLVLLLRESHHSCLNIITLNLCSCLLTITAVICWSINTKMVVKSAGISAAGISHRGFLSLIGFINQFRSGLVGWLSCIGPLVLLLPDLSRFWLSYIGPLVLLLPDLSRCWLSCINPLVLLLPDLSSIGQSKSTKVWKQ
jgi:hypothetical protein